MPKSSRLALALALLFGCSEGATPAALALEAARDAGAPTAPPASASAAANAKPDELDGGSAPPLDAGAAESDAGAAEGDAGPPDAGPPSPCPDAAMARIGRTCVDRWEAHLVTPMDGGLSPLPANERPPEDATYIAASEAGVLPQAYISRVEASRACKNAGKRLCSMTEWRRACQGPSGTHYPYGPNAVHGACNVGKPHLLALKFGSNAHHWTYEHFNDPSLDLEEGFLAKTGAFAGCESAAGTFDMAGNLHEWVSDAVDDAFLERMAADKVERNTQPSHTGDGVFVGGFFSTTDQHGPGCLFTTIAHEPTYHDYSIGFRCCADAAPETPKPKKPRRRRR